MHSQAYAFVAEQAHAMRVLRYPRRIVEIGGRDVNGSVRELFVKSQYTSIDLVDGPGVDVVADGKTYRPAVPPDLVLCCEVLEHEPNPEALIRNSFDMLAPNGALLLTCASDPREPHSAIDGRPQLRDGEHYRNIDPTELTRWLREIGFEPAGVQYHWRGDLYALAFKPEIAR